jgi:hypothetical protein
MDRGAVWITGPITAPCQQDHGVRGFIPETVVAPAWTSQDFLWVPVYGVASVPALGLSRKSGLAERSLIPVHLLCPEDA